MSSNRSDAMFSAKPDGVMCSGGSRYFHLKPNGDMYPCSANGCNGETEFVVGNVKSYEFEPEDLVPCPRYCCNNQCDKLLTIRMEGGKKEVGMVLFDDYFKDVKKENICILNIILNNGCNFNCYYCNPQLYRPYDSINAQDWMHFFKKCSTRFEYGIVQLLGGEPTIYPGFMDLVRFWMDKKWKISIITNMSMSNARFEELLGLTQKFHHHVGFYVSLHPSSDAFDYAKVLDRMTRLHRAGFLVLYSLVMVPTQLYLYDRFKADMDERGIGGYILNPFGWRFSRQDADRLNEIHGKDVFNNGECGMIVE